VNKSTKTIRNR